MSGLISSESLDGLVSTITTPVASSVSGIMLLGMTINDWVLVGTGLLLLVNISTKIWQGIKFIKRVVKESDKIE